MQKLYVIAALAGLGVGVYLAYNYQVTPDVVFGVLGQAGKVAQDLFGQVAAWWNGVPEIGRGLILAGIPTLFTLFFAWTKSRAIEKMQQTQQLAQQKIGGLQEKIVGLTDVSEENRLLKQKIDSLQNTDLIDEAQRIASEKSAQAELLQKQLYESNVVIRTLQEELDRAKLKIHETTVVK